jgi:hypothetical protein
METHLVPAPNRDGMTSRSTKNLFATAPDTAIHIQFSSADLDKLNGSLRLQYVDQFLAILGPPNNGTSASASKPYAAGSTPMRDSVAGIG